jgi:hypothetical protein
MSRDRRDWWIFFAVMVAAAVVGGLLGRCLR